ncbi:unnamed protein product, partial [Thelazia callipaeda]|uniref:Acyl_transf_3 domain-containing protein n=1 Tax=Thelazia callipaeda TaxID=103827 RepID=A0A0N5CTZ4_THECL
VIKLVVLFRNFKYSKFLIINKIFCFYFQAVLLRLSPPYYITIAFYTFIFKILLVNMPVLLLSANDYCEKNWWTNFLYVNNFVHYDKQCYTPSWYLAVDFQLYLFSPILLVPLALKPTVGFCIAGLLLLFSTIFNFATVYTEYFPPSDFSGAMDPRMAQYFLILVIFILFKNPHQI